MKRRFSYRTESDLFSNPDPPHFCICLKRGGSGRADFLLPKQVGGEMETEGTLLGIPSEFHPESLARFEVAERQEMWPRLDNSGGSYFCKWIAESRQGGVCSVSCWLFCQMWAAECGFMYQNELFVLCGHTNAAASTSTRRHATQNLLFINQEFYNTPVFLEDRTCFGPDFGIWLSMDWEVTSDATFDKNLMWNFGPRHLLPSFFPPSFFWDAK